MCPKANFLHLSDFHTRKNYEWDNVHVFKHFKGDIKKWQTRKNQEIDGILITGDIAYSGHPDEYKLVSDKINEIMKLTHVKMENIFFVPGNHDINRNAITKPEDETTKSILDGNSDVNEYFRKYDDYEIFLKKFHAYNHFLKKINNHNTWQIDGGKMKPWYSIRKEINGIQFQIVGLTSSLFISKNEDLLGKIHIGARQIQESLNPVIGNEFVIILAHHPFDWLSSDDKTLLQTTIGYHKRAIFLHGHAHQYQIEQRSLFNSHLRCIEAGSVDSKSDNPNRYHILQIDLNSNKLTLWPRKWCHGQWIEDTEWQKLDEDESCTIELPISDPIIDRPYKTITEKKIAPYCLNNTQLSFKQFPEILKETADKEGKVEIAVVVGSGRFKEADHVSYGTDCCGIPEITTLLNTIPGTHISSCLDIDIFNTKDIEEKNLILLGSGKVNYVTMRLLERFQGSLCFRFNHPEYTTLKSSVSGKTYTDGDQNDWGLGILSLTQNPWATDVNKQRIIILLAGFHPLGSMAANKLLCQFIENVGKREDCRLPQIQGALEDFGSNMPFPFKIVRGQRLDFSIYLNKISDIIENPIRNKTYIGNLKGEPIIIE